MPDENADTSSDRQVDLRSDVQPAVEAGWLRALLFMIAFFFFAIFQELVILIISGLAVDSIEEFFETFDKPSMIPVQVWVLSSTVFFVWLFRKVVDRRSLMSLGFSFDREKRKDLAVGFLWGAGMTLLIFLVLYLAGVAAIVGVRFPAGLLATAALNISLAAAVEEIVMRGYLLNNLMQSVNRYLALLLISVIFSLGHGFNPNFTIIGLINIILAGVFLGIYYIHRRNLWFPIGLHIGWNFFQGAIFGSPISGIRIASIMKVEFSGSNLISGGEFGFEGSLAATAVAAIGIILLQMKYRRRSDENIPEIDK